MGGKPSSARRRTGLVSLSRVTVGGQLLGPISLPSAYRKPGPLLNPVFSSENLILGRQIPGLILAQNSPKGVENTPFLSLHVKFRTGSLAPGRSPRLQLSCYSSGAAD